MNVVALSLAAFGFCIALYAATETEIAHLGRRITIGLLGLGLFVLGVILV